MADEVKRHPSLDTNGVTDEQLAEWKRQFRRIGCSCYSGQWYIYRPLLRIEMRELQDVKGAAVADFEEKVATRALLVPKVTELYLRGNTAGLATSLSNEILALSDYESEGTARL